MEKRYKKQKALLLSKTMFWLCLLIFLSEIKILAQSKVKVSPCEEKLNLCEKVHNLQKKLTLRQNEHHTISFDAKGRIIGGVPSILRRGDAIRFAIVGNNVEILKTNLSKKIKKFEASLEEANYSKLSENSIFKTLFPLEQNFNNYKKLFKQCYLQTATSHPKIDSLFKINISFAGKPCDNSKFKFSFSEIDCGFITNENTIPCDYNGNEIDFQLTMEDIYFKTIREYLESSKSYNDCPSFDAKFKDWDDFKTAFASIQAQFLKEAKIIDDELALYNTELLRNVNAEPNSSLMKKLEEIKPVSQTISNTITSHVIEPNKEWIIRWLWFTGLDNPLTNPFNFKSTIAGLATQNSEQIISVEGKIADLKSILEKSTLPENNDKIMTETLKKLEELRSQLVKLKSDKERLEKQLKGYNTWNANLSASAKILNIGKFFVSDNEGIFWMPQYDANNAYKAMNEENTLPDMVAEIDAVRPLVHNVPKGTKVGSEETIKGFTVVTPLAEAFENFGGVFDNILINAKAVNTSGIDAALATISSAIKSKTDEITNINEKITKNEADIKLKKDAVKILAISEQSKVIPFFKPEDVVLLQENNIQINNEENKKKGILVKKNIERRGILNKEIVNLKSEKQDLIREQKKLEAEKRKLEAEKRKLEYEKNLSTFNAAKAILSWYSNQSYPNLDKIELSKPDTVYHTDWARPKTGESKKGSNEVSYDLKANDGKKTETVVSKEVYKIYDTQRFWYGVGLAYVPNTRNTNVFDNATNTFQVNPEPQQLDIIVGAKWYPFKGMNETRTRQRAYFTNYGKLYQYNRGNSGLNAVSVFMGLGVRYKFLRNYFVGIGYDIIPGLNVQAGVNAYFENRYDISNGKLLQVYERFVFNRGYVAITTDMSVITRLVKLINPF